MAQTAIHRNEPALRWVRAAVFAVAVGGALNAMAFRPTGIALAAAVGVGALALFSPALAVVASVILMSLPLLAANLLVGAAFLIVGLASVQYLSHNNGRIFLLFALAFAGAAYGPVWAVAPIAGYLLGAGEGAIVSVLACVALEAAGITLGRESLGAVFAGGAGTGLVTFDAPPDNLLAFSWLAPSLDALDPAGLLDAVTASNAKAMLAAQPLIWGAAAALSGVIRRPASDPRRKPFALLAVAGGAIALALGSAISLSLLTGIEVSGALLGTTLASSLVVALAFAAIWEWVFAPIPKPTAPAVRPGTMQAEDADVDELLRLIATAEDQLESKHSTQAAVMITDMKSFSKMTEEEGSVTSAKTIQRHRDLLLPVIVECGGHGKSTGGDGLLASFTTNEDAIRAASRMQETLQAYNSEHDCERDIVVRIGIASGEVVLDNGGCPFIGAALNLSARVMNLGDGGQILVTRDVARSASDVKAKVHAHGPYDLKNIAEPTEVYEILWAEGQEPLDPVGKRSGTPE